MIGVNEGPGLMLLGQTITVSDNGIVEIVYPDGCSLRVQGHSGVKNRLTVQQIIEIYSRTPCIHGMAARCESMGLLGDAERLRKQIAKNEREYHLEMSKRGQA